MPPPVISATQSYLGFKRNEAFQFQPVATFLPTSWAITPITAGLSFDTTTGRISSNGVGVQGPIVVILSATNASGTGTREFVIGISAGSETTAGAADTAIDLVTDVVTNITRLGRPGAGATTPDAGAASLAYVKEGDTRLFVHRFEKNGVQVDPDLTALKMVFKSEEPERVLVSAAAFEKTGTGASAAWLMPVTFSGSLLKSALADREKPLGTTFAALTEIEWRRSIIFNGSPTVLIGTSRTFFTQIDRDLADN